MNDPSIHLLLASLLAAAPLASQIAVPPVQPIAPIQPAVVATAVRVQATIVDGVATTRIEQTLRNSGRGNAEAQWLLPLPDGALADKFTMTMNGQVVASEVLDAANARQIYEDIVRRQRDPGLLEYYGTGCLRARVFPIPAGGTVDVVVQYRQILPVTSGLHEWTFPLRAISGIEGAKLTLEARIESREPIKNVYSPLGNLDVVRRDDHHAHASLELPAGSIPDRDLQLFYGTTSQALGLNLLTHRQGDIGHFLLMLEPRHEWAEPKHVARSVQFVIDTSGSMKGQKIEQARAALRFFVQSLKPHDLFNVVPFSTEARPFFEQPVAATAEHVKLALERIAAIDAVGGTNIDDAMRCALTAALPNGVTELKLVPITVFLTDGQPTIGTVDPDQLLKNLAQHNTNHSRVFVFGVGDDVNTRLLDRVAQDTRGDRDYVREHENIEVKTSALFTKLSHPVMTDLALVFDGIEILDRAPNQLPDLFKGSRLLVLGRYRGDGPRAIRLRGVVDGTRQELVFEGSFTKDSTTHDFVPALWAERRVGVLLEAIRLNGQSKELIDEVQRLGREFNLVTPYTSHLIVEENARVAHARGFDDALRFRSIDLDAGVIRDLRRAGGEAISVRDVREKLGRAQAEQDAAKRNLDDLAAAPEAGRAAVDRSIELKIMNISESIDTISNARAPAARLASRRVGARNFHLIGNAWVDQEFAPRHHGNERKIAAFSDEYFELLRRHPELAKAYAFSARLVVVLPDGSAVEITS